MKTSTHFNLSKKQVQTYPCSQSNQITKEYYWCLVGQINNGTCFKSVCRIENHTHGIESYYLISEI